MRLAAIIAVGKYRTWRGSPLEKKALCAVASEADGWGNQSEAGVNCNESESTIRFRVTWKHINSIHKKLVLFFEAEVPDEYVISTLFVNGRNIGEYSLELARIDVPLILLRPLGLIDIVMQHQFTVSDSAKHIESNAGKYGFTLSLLKYRLAADD